MSDKGVEGLRYELDDAKRWLSDPELRGCGGDEAVIRLLESQAAEISRLREALEEIAYWGTSQPAALNMPEPDWHRMVCKQIGRAANAALTGDPQ